METEVTTESTSTEELSELEALLLAKQKKEAEAKVKDKDEAEDPGLEPWMEMLEKQGLSKTDLNMLKEKHGKIYTYVWDEDSIFLFRPLKRKEYNIINQVSETEEDRKMHILKTGFVWPGTITQERLENEIAGRYDVIAELIFRVSGFIPIAEAMSMVREL